MTSALPSKAAVQIFRGIISAGDPFRTVANLPHWLIARGSIEATYRSRVARSNFAGFGSGD
jgi:hypothetical protein